MMRKIIISSMQYPLPVIFEYGTVPTYAAVLAIKN